MKEIKNVFVLKLVMLTSLLTFFICSYICGDQVVVHHNNYCEGFGKQLNIDTSFLTSCLVLTYHCVGQDTTYCHHQLMVVSHL